METAPDTAPLLPPGVMAPGAVSVPVTGGATWAFTAVAPVGRVKPAAAAAVPAEAVGPAVSSAPVAAFVAAVPGVPGPRHGWSEVLLFYALGNQHRRRMFYLIVREPAGFTIKQMAAQVREKRSVTGKHLEILARTDAVVVMKRGRDSVHMLHPSLRAQLAAVPGWLDFGFMKLRVPER